MCDEASSSPTEVTHFIIIIIIVKKNADLLVFVFYKKLLHFNHNPWRDLLNRWIELNNNEPAPSFRTTHGNKTPPHYNTATGLTLPPSSPRARPWFYPPQPLPPRSDSPEEQQKNKTSLSLSYNLKNRNIFQHQLHKLSVMGLQMDGALVINGGAFWPIGMKRLATVLWNN